MVNNDYDNNNDNNNNNNNNNDVLSYIFPFFIFYI